MQTSLKEPFNREKQFANKRRAVIRAAGEAFRRRGYHNTSMTEIAKALGLTKTALYYYVNSKEEILFECHIMVYDAFDECVKEHKGKGANGLSELSTVFSELVKLLTRDGLSLLTDVSSLSGNWQKDVLKRRGKIESRVTDIVKRGMKDGSIRGGDPQLTVFFFMGALNWLNAWYAPGGRLSGDLIAEQFTAQMRNGLAA
ncbi:MAG: TetR/AcrR family transcriptional regulator [Hellea sp.]|nr:TetR/AcrR family transcriptional regulator [Hellea sp.]